MPLAIERILAPALGHPGRSKDETYGHQFDISVVFTSVHSTLGALREAARLAHSLDARVTLVIAQVVPWPLPLESPTVRPEFNETRFRVLAGESPVETSVHVYLCRERFQTLTSVLVPGSIVVLGGRKRAWWPTPDQSLARKLRRAGFEVIFKETE